MSAPAKFAKFVSAKRVAFQLCAIHLQLFQTLRTKDFDLRQDEVAIGKFQGDERVACDHGCDVETNRVSASGALEYGWRTGKSSNFISHCFNGLWCLSSMGIDVTVALNVRALY